MTMTGEPTAAVQADLTPQPTAVAGQTDMTLPPNRAGFSDADMRSVLGSVIQERFANFTIIELNAIETLIIDPAQ